MHEYEEETKDGFRSKWSRNGKLLSSHQIIATLRSNNRNKAGELVTAAKQKFSAQEFDKIFSYRSKGGNARIMTSPSAIAKRYHKSTRSMVMTPPSMGGELSEFFWL
jgi:hypothetical protein